MVQGDDGKKLFYPGIQQAVGLLLYYILLSGFLYIIFANFLSADIIQTGIDTFLVSVFTCSILLCGGFLKVKEKKEDVFPLKSVRISVVLPYLLFLCGVLIISSEVDNVVNYFFPMPLWITQMMLDVVKPEIFPMMGLIVLAPLFEEMLFRGLILNGFLKRYSVKKSIVVSALLFAALHLNIYQFFNAFLFGVLSAWIRICTRSLLPCILGHVFLNGMVWVVGNFQVPYIPGFSVSAEDLLTRQMVEFQPMWFNGLGVLLCCIGYFSLKRIFLANSVESEC